MSILTAKQTKTLNLSDKISLDFNETKEGDLISQTSLAKAVSRGNSSVISWVKNTGVNFISVKTVEGPIAKCLTIEDAVRYCSSQAMNNNKLAMSIVIVQAQANLEKLASELFGRHIPSIQETEINLKAQERLAELAQCRDDFTAGHPNFQTFCYTNNINPAIAHDKLSCAIFGPQFTAEYFRNNYPHNNTRGTHYGVDHYPEGWMITLMNYAKGMFCNNKAEDLDERVSRAHQKAMIYYRRHLAQLNPNEKNQVTM